MARELQPTSAIMFAGALVIVLVWWAWNKGNNG